MDKYIATITINLAKSPDSKKKKQLTAKFALLNKNYDEVKKKMAATYDLNKAKSYLSWATGPANAMKRDPDRQINQGNVGKLEKYLKKAEENMKGAPDSPRKKKLDEQLKELKKILEEAKSAL